LPITGSFPGTGRSRGVSGKKLSEKKIFGLGAGTWSQSTGKGNRPRNDEIFIALSKAWGGRGELQSEAVKSVSKKIGVTYVGGKFRRLTLLVGQEN